MGTRSNTKAATESSTDNHIQDQVIVAVKPEEDVLEMLHVFGNAAVEDGEGFHQNQEHVDHGGISNDDAEACRMASRPASKRATFRNTRQSRISSAGPEANAEARNRGASTAVIQKVRPGSPL